MMAGSVDVSLYRRNEGDNENEPQVFSKHLAVSILSRNRASATGLMANPALEQSDRVQNVGMIYHRSVSLHSNDLSIVLSP